MCSETFNEEVVFGCKFTFFTKSKPDYILKDR
jgi:hypothetical protein